MAMVHANVFSSHLVQFVFLVLVHHTFFGDQLQLEANVSTVC